MMNDINMYDMYDIYDIYPWKSMILNDDFRGFSWIFIIKPWRVGRIRCNQVSWAWHQGIRGGSNAQLPSGYDYNVGPPK